MDLFRPRTLALAALALAASGLVAARTPGETPSDLAPEGACGPTSFTQNSSLTPEPLASVACHDSSDRHRDSSWWRSFRLAEHGVAGDLTVCAVDVTIEVAQSGSGTGQPMTINLWQNSEDCHFPAGTRTLLATTTVNVADQSLSSLSVAIGALVPALSELVVEIAVPDGVAQNDVFFVGSNDDGQTRPTYVSSTACLWPTPVDLAALGAPDSHVIITVVGDQGRLGPAAISVDAPGNGVIELGEPVEVETSYANLTSGSIALFGLTTSITAPPPYSAMTPDPNADFGDVPSGETRSCLDGAGCYTIQYDGAGYGHRDGTLEETLSAVPNAPTGNDLVRTRAMHIGESFADVPTSNIFYRFIETLLHSGVTGGCAVADSYCPADTTLRKQMAVFLLKALFGACYLPPAAAGIFADVPMNDPFAPWIEDLFHRAITGGCGGNLYCPNDAVKRKQMAVFLLKTLLGSGYLPPTATGIFDDVPQDGFQAWIEDLYNRGYTGGCAGGPPPAPIFYCPEDPVTRGQMATFLVKTFSLLLYRP